MNDRELIEKYLEDRSFVDPRVYREVERRGLTRIISNLPQEKTAALTEAQQRLEQSASVAGQGTTTDHPPMIHPSALVSSTSLKEISKLTRKAVSKFLRWSSTRYNDYLGYGTKKENVERVFLAMKNGHHNNQTSFVIRSASPAGENPYHSSGYRTWRIKGDGEEYLVDCEQKTIKAKYTNREITFV